jgi:hypothetical protein
MNQLTRSDVIKRLFVLPALAGALAAGAMTVARADQRTDLKYQSTPKGDQKCSNCVLFTAGKTSTAAGTCKVIPGDISPNGWCTAFAKRSS